MKKKFNKEQLVELVWGDHDEGWEVLEDTISYTSRWSEHHKLVFKFDGKIYGTTYSQGLTEMQDESPFEYENDEIECMELEPYERTIIAYREKKKQEEE